MSQQFIFISFQKQSLNQKSMESTIAHSYVQTHTPPMTHCKQINFVLLSFSSAFYKMEALAVTTS
jgi:hypothetical protein